MSRRFLGRLALVAVGLVGGWALTAISAQVSTQPADVSTTRVGTPDSPLMTLDWLVGDWVATTDNGTIEFSCSYTKNNAFLIRSFRITADSQVTMSGMQVVAWDPAQQAIRSWTFDSDGGFGEDIWTQRGASYTMRSKYTLADGGTGSAINMMSYISPTEFAWKSTHREVDGQLQGYGPAIGFKRVGGGSGAAAGLGADGGSN